LLRKKFPATNKALLDACYAKKWVAYCKPPFGSANQVVAYLGRYTHRIAISNNRIQSLENGKVTFLWRDYAHGGEMKPMKLDAEEFIRRFLLHILPSGFRKIRHYGLFAFRDKGRRLALCESSPILLRRSLPRQRWSVCKKSWAGILTSAPAVVRASFPGTHLLLMYIPHKLLKKSLFGGGGSYAFFPALVR